MPSHGFLMNTAGSAIGGGGLLGVRSCGEQAMLDSCIRTHNRPSARRKAMHVNQAAFSSRLRHNGVALLPSLLGGEGAVL